MNTNGHESPKHTDPLLSYLVLIHVFSWLT